MRKLNEIADDLRGILSSKFKTVRITTVQNQEQLLAEISAINVDKLPGVVIVFEQTVYTSDNCVREATLSLVLIDKFVAANDARALSVLAAYETLLDLFTADGLQHNGVFYLPVDCVAASVDKGFACLALRIVAKQ